MKILYIYIFRDGWKIYISIWSITFFSDNFERAPRTNKIRSSFNFKLIKIFTLQFSSQFLTLDRCLSYLHTHTRAHTPTASFTILFEAIERKFIRQSLQRLWLHTSGVYISAFERNRFNLASRFAWTFIQFYRLRRFFFFFFIRENIGHLDAKLLLFSPPSFLPLIIFLPSSGAITFLHLLLVHTHTHTHEFSSNFPFSLNDRVYKSYDG